MKSSADYKPSHSIAILCVGNPGTGKTRLMMSLPTPGILDNDLNLNSAVRVSGGKKFFFTQPSMDDNGKEIPEHLRWLAVEKEVKAMILHPEIQSICIDGLTALSRWCLAYAEHQLIAAGINVKKEYLSKYANFINLMTNFVNMCRIGGKIVFMSCHQTADKNDLTGAWYYNLSIPGQLKDNLGGLFTDVWGTSTQTLGDDVKYFINTRPTNLHVALKTSFDLAPKIDVTNKSPDAIWRELEPKLSIYVQPQKPVNAKP